MFLRIEENHDPTTPYLGIHFFKDKNKVICTEIFGQFRNNLQNRIAQTYLNLSIFEIHCHPSSGLRGVAVITSV